LIEEEDAILRTNFSSSDIEMIEMVMQASSRFMTDSVGGWKKKDQARKMYQFPKCIPVEGFFRKPY